MTHRPERWETIWSIFHSVLEAPAEQRDARIEQLCAGNAALQREVASLLAAHEGDDPVLDHPELASESLPPPPALEGRRIGPYRLVRKLGAGGMGAVYLAERIDDEFEHRVAIKLIQPGLDGEEIVSRFEQERQILASLDHPNIARLFDGGQWEGRPYFVLEHVDGDPIDRYCRRRELSTRQILELFLGVCGAVAVAHRRLVVHRDLKPGNILVTPEGAPKLLDFGVAKLLDAEADQATATQARRMTPHYASPEQIRGDPVTTQSDVYSLGVVLYELLTGSSPYRPRSDSPHELMRAILETPVDAPSTAARRAGRRRGKDGDPSGETRWSRLRLDGDLDNVVLTALHRDPERRYASVERFADDLRRYLGGLPVAARPDTFPYRLSKFVGRHRVAVGASALAIVALLTTTTTAVLQTARTRQALVEASRQRDVAESVTDFLRETFTAADPWTESELPQTPKDLLDRGAQRALEELEEQPEIQASVQRIIGEVYGNMGLDAEAEQQMERAVATFERLRGPGDPAVGEGLALLGRYRLDQGRVEEAETALRSGLDRLLAAQGPDDAAVARARITLGALEERLGDHEAAETQLREAVRVLEAAGDEGAMAGGLIHLASLERVQGKYAEAERSFRRALDVFRRSLREDHPQVLRARRSLGDLYLEWGELDRAEEEYRTALEGLRAQDLDTRAVLNSLASLLRKRGDLEQAERLYREVWDLQRAKHGEGNVAVASPLTNLALVVQEQGRLDEAEPLSRRVVEIYSDAYGPESPRLIAPLNNLGLLLHAKGDLAAADDHYRRCERLARETLGDRHPAVAYPLTNRADLAFDRGELEAAETLYRSALELRREVLPEGHVDLAPTLGGLGRLLVETGRAGEAEPMLREALGLREKQYPDDDWHVAAARSDLGACLLELGSVAEASPLLEGGYRTLVEARGPDDPRTERAGARLERLRASSPP